MRYLGLDVGDRRIGVALSDETGTLASPLETYERTGPRKDLKAIARLVRERGVGGVVVGLPRRLDGEVGPQSQKVLEFMDALRPVVGVSVVPWDERFTTVVARQALVEAGVSRRTRKEVIDKVSVVCSRLSCHPERSEGSGRGNASTAQILCSAPTRWASGEPLARPSSRRAQRGEICKTIS